MQAVTFQGVENVRCETVPDPRIESPTDALVAVRMAGICGSDLHVYHGRETGLDRGTALGHEFVGEVLEVGSDVTRIRPGALVASPFTTNCGTCPPCKTGLTGRCLRGELFGWREQGRGLHGTQAELVRVPLADHTLVEVPAGISTEAALLAGDVLSTGYFCAHQGGVEPGSSVGVIGCGPVGLMAILAARHLGAGHILALDRQPERLDLARGFGAETINTLTNNPGDRVEELTGGLGMDIILEAVGSSEASRLGFDLLRAGGTLSVVGVHTEPRFAFSPVDAYDKNLTLRIGRCPARHYMDIVFPLLDEISEDPTVIISHRLSLADAVRGYRIFADKLDGCTKVVLTP